MKRVGELELLRNQLSAYDQNTDRNVDGKGHMDKASDGKKEYHIRNQGPF